MQKSEHASWSTFTHSREVVENIITKMIISSKKMDESTDVAYLILGRYTGGRTFKLFGIGGIGLPSSLSYLAFHRATSSIKG